MVVCLVGSPKHGQRLGGGRLMDYALLFVMLATMALMVLSVVASAREITRDWKEND